MERRGGFERGWLVSIGERRDEMNISWLDLIAIRMRDSAMSDLLMLEVSS
jgi:hypothetical protein